MRYTIVETKQVCIHRYEIAPKRPVRCSFTTTKAGLSPEKAILPEQASQLLNFIYYYFTRGVFGTHGLDVQNLGIRVEEIVWGETVFVVAARHGYVENIGQVQEARFTLQ